MGYKAFYRVQLYNWIIQINLTLVSRYELALTHFGVNLSRYKWVLMSDWWFRESRAHPIQPYSSDGVYWSQFGLVMCSSLLNVACMPAYSKGFPSCAALSYSALWEAAARVSLIWHGITGSLERSLTRHMSLDGVWLRHLFEHIPLPFVYSIAGRIKLFRNMCGVGVCMDLLPFGFIFTEACSYSMSLVW